MSLSPLTIHPNTVPSSFRKPVQNSRVSRSSVSHSFLADVKAELIKVRPALEKNRFSLMPQESEDAKITGSTRSLERRLLALNVYGSRSLRGTNAA